MAYGQNVEDAVEDGAYRQLAYEAPATATTLLLIRHGESAALADGADGPEVERRADPSLAEAGHGRAERVSERLRHEPIDAVYVSPLRRTTETARPLLDALALEPTVDRDLIEVFLGDWEGGTFRRMLVEQHPLVKRLWREERWDVIPNAEPADAFAARVDAVIRRIAAAHVGGTVAIFSHGGVIAQALAGAARARPFAFVDVNNGSISQLVIDGERATVRGYNDRTHLERHLRVSEPLI